MAFGPVVIRQSKTRLRLRSVVIGADEVALEMSGKDTRCTGAAAHARTCHLSENGLERFRRTRHRRRAERRHAITRKTGCDLRNRSRAVQRVVPLDAVNMHVHETRNYEILTRLDNGGGRRRAPSRLDSGHAVTVEHERYVGQDEIRQDDVAAGADNHGENITARATT